MRIAAWARLIAKVYEVDPMVCVRCGSPMRILAIITDPEEIKKILRHLAKTGKPPPGLDASTLNQPTTSNLLPEVNSRSAVARTADNPPLLKASAERDSLMAASRCHLSRHVGPHHQS